MIRPKDDRQFLFGKVAQRGCCSMTLLGMMQGDVGIFLAEELLGWCQMSRLEPVLGQRVELRPEVDQEQESGEGDTEVKVLFCQPLDELAVSDLCRCVAIFAICSLFHP